MTHNDPDIAKAAAPVSSRRCGDCQLCCKLLPVAELDKPAGKRCRHQRFNVGCTIYRDRPVSCAIWQCRWVINDDADDLRRPDRAHYVIDIMADFVRATDDNTGEKHTLPVLQVWLDPDYPDAHNDPALRAYLDRNKISALVRLDNRHAFLLAPPSVNSAGTWYVGATSANGEKQHSAAEIDRVLVEHFRNDADAET